MIQSPYTFGKAEKLVSRKLIEQLFSGGNGRSMAAFPLRGVFMKKERGEGEPPAQVMVSVSKRHFKHAVKRNRVKRQVREAYRQNKSLLWSAFEQQPETALAVAFIWQTNKIVDTSLVMEKMQLLLTRMAEKVLNNGQSGRVV